MEKIVEKKEEKKNVIAYIRVGQALCLGIFTLGISMMFGDIAGAIKLPISTLSITTTLFGGIGAIITEVFARKAKQWWKEHGYWQATCLPFLACT